AKVTVSDKFYTGKALKPAATVKLGWKKLISGTDYKVSYKNNKNVGKATVTVTGKGCCTGKTSGTFVIKPGKEKLTSFNSPAKKSVKAKWVRDKQATGYQLRLATNKAFTKGSKTVWIKKNSATARTIKGLKSGKTYYFRLRAYKVMDGKKYYGKYSNIKKVKVK
ncbi:MAG: cobalamin biosynthesis protein CobT, partial [Ruminococcus sp.]|nr:cobalamin biosynthesis protein CobT [Ruminococcus sp.]